MKENVIQYLLKEQQKLGFIKTTAEFQVEYTRLSETVNADAMGASFKEQSGRTDAKAMNDNFNQVYIYLLTAFEQLNAVGGTIDKHQKLNASIISNMKTKLSQMEDKVNTLEDKFSNRTGDLVHIQNFRSTDSFEPNVNLYTDEVGELVSDAYRVSYDKYSETIRLPKLIAMNKLIATNGQKMAVIKINKQLGSGLINMKNPVNTLDKAIDTDMESYWEETILSDQPIRVELDAETYYKVGFGAVCELEVVFNSIVEINELTMLPFGQFPLEIIAIRYYNSDQPDDEEALILSTKSDLTSIEIVGPTKGNGLGSSMISDNISYQFPAVAAKRLRIILNQQHYIKNSFVYDKKETEKNNMWFNRTAKILFGFKKAAQGLYRLKAIKDIPWILFNKSVEEQGGDLDIEEMLLSKKTELIPVTKYEYNYGLYNISANENNYKNTGIYISKSIKLAYNIGMVTLSSKETIPSSDCEIKYFITSSVEPTGAEWIPILPGASIDFKSMITSGAMDVGMNKEKFFGTSGTTIELANTPYTDYTDLTMVPVKLTVIDNTGKLTNEDVLSRVKDVILDPLADPEIIIPPVIEYYQNIQNVTNYYDTAISYKNFVKGSQSIQYYFHRNKIYFNISLPKDYIIEVDYKHFINNIRVKAVFLKSDSGDKGLSPLLHSYTLTFKPML